MCISVQVCKSRFPTEFELVTLTMLICYSHVFYMDHLMNAHKDTTLASSLLASCNV